MSTKVLFIAIFITFSVQTCSSSRKLGEPKSWLQPTLNIEHNFNSSSAVSAENLQTINSCRKVQAFLETHETDHEFSISWINPNDNGQETFQGFLSKLQPSLTVMNGCAGYQFAFSQKNHTSEAPSPVVIYQLGSDAVQKVKIGSQASCYVVPSELHYDDFRPEAANHTFFGALMPFLHRSRNEVTDIMTYFLGEEDRWSCVHRPCYVQNPDDFDLLEKLYDSGSYVLQAALEEFLVASEGTAHESKVHGMLGHLYLNREDGPFMLSEAMGHLWIASLAGEPLSQGTLGVLARVLGEHYLWSLLSSAHSSFPGGLPRFPEDKDILKATTKAFLHCGASGGAVSAQATLGFQTLFGFGQTADCDAAYEYYSQAALQVLERQPLLATRVDDVNLAHEKDRWKPLEIYDEEFEWLSLLASKGDPQAMLQLGELQLFGSGAEGNPEEAYEWFDKAANKGVARALSRQGLMHWHGIGKETNLTSAKEYMTVACELGDAEGCYQLGYLNSFGAEPGAENYTEALRCFLLSAEKDFADALYFLGLLYYHGKGVVQDLEQAYWHISKASAFGSQQAHNLKAIMQYQGLGTNQSCHGAMDSWRVLINQGIVRTHLIHARYHFLSHHWMQSLVHYGMLAEEGHVNAQKNTAWLLSHNDVGPTIHHENLTHDIDGATLVGSQCSEMQDPSLDLAIEQYYVMAAKQNDPESLFQLGNIYFERWAQNGNEMGIPSGTLFEKSLQYYHEAAKGCHAQALFTLGSFYYNGYGVLPNFELAISYFQNASSCSDEAFFPSIIAILGIHLRLCAEKALFWVNKEESPFISLPSLSFEELSSLFLSYEDSILVTLVSLLVLSGSIFLFKFYQW